MIGFAMRNGVPAFLVFALLAAPPRAGGAEEAPRAPGLVTLSDGTTVEGDVRTTAGKPLRLVESGTGRRLDLTVEDVWRIRVTVTAEEQYRIWRWVEDGSREKVFTGESYPRREYETEVVLRTGQVHRGVMTAVLYVYPKDREKPVKYILRKEDRGEIGEMLTDLAYVESVEFPAAKPPSEGEAFASIRLVVSPPDALVTAHAVPRGRLGATEGSRTMTRGAAAFPGILPGVYDLAVVATDRIYFALGTGEGGGEEMTGEALAEVRARVAEIPDFFETKEVLAAVRDGDRVQAMVRKERTGVNTLEAGQVFRRWEIWTLHRGGDRWLVDARAWIWREHGADLGPAREAVSSPALRGIVVETDVTEVEFAATQGENR